jgi:hypothetical protein
VCRAAVQAAAYQLLVRGGWLSREEACLVRWATNSASVAPPSHATRQQYKQATAVEALVRAASRTHAACVQGLQWHTAWLQLLLPLPCHAMLCAHWSSSCASCAWDCTVVAATNSAVEQGDVGSATVAVQYQLHVFGISCMMRWHNAAAVCCTAAPGGASVPDRHCTLAAADGVAAAAAAPQAVAAAAACSSAAPSQCCQAGQRQPQS